MASEQPKQGDRKGGRVYLTDAKGRGGRWTDTMDRARLAASIRASLNQGAKR